MVNLLFELILYACHFKYDLKYIFIFLFLFFFNFDNLVKNFLKYVDIAVNASFGLEKNLHSKFPVLCFYFSEASSFLEAML